MLSVSSMALAAMLAPACGTNMANINDCKRFTIREIVPRQYRYQKGG